MFLSEKFTWHNFVVERLIQSPDNELQENNKTSEEIFNPSN